MNKKWLLLREKYPKFYYLGYKWEKRKDAFWVGFEFEIGEEIRFEPQILIRGSEVVNLNKLDREVLDNLVFNLGLAEIPSYWKCTCSPQILIKAGYLSKNQIAWWEKFLIDEMSQYYFENKIDFRQKGLVKVIVAAESKTLKKAKVLGDNSLVAVGGGKDSALTLELLKRAKISFGTFIINPLSSSVKVSRFAKSRELITVKREIDPKLLELNKRGYLNGHTPIVAYMSFLGILVSYLYGYKRVIFSNERSADEGNLLYLGKLVNHQHDKSYEFEKRFRKYNNRYLSDVAYFSFLRPIGELQIAKLFSEVGEKYFNTFISCNVGQKENYWCLKCPKCLSTFMLLYPFLGEKISKVMGKNLYEDTNFKNLLDSLILPNVQKPFECVATKQEMAIAVLLAWDKKYNEGLKLLNYAYNLIKKNHLNNGLEMKSVLSEYSNRHFLPIEFERILKVAVEK